MAHDPGVPYEARPKTLKEHFAHRKAKKAKRLSNRRFIAKTSGKVLAPTRTTLRAQLDHLWGLIVIRRDRAAFGHLCRICKVQPATLGYHIVPKQRGDSVRWLLENGCAARFACNGAEVMNRSLYRDKHVQIFGRELVERIEARARARIKLSTADLREMRDEFKLRLERGP